jgi:predicted AlkP superfamily pyrophosphatase or phosphodiesterase
MRNRRGIGVGLFIGALLACAGPAPELNLAIPTLSGPPKHPNHVVLVSVGGLSADRYRNAGAGEPAMPMLARLAEAGVSADRVHPVAPASSYPAHASLVTGRRPAVHGIVANRRLGDHGVRQAVYSHASLLRAPTLWQLATQAQLRVASLDWPSTVGASISQLLPDLEPSRPGDTWLSVLSDASTPELMAVTRAAGGADPAVRRPGADRDAVLVEVACRLLASPERPRLILLHLRGSLASIIAEGSRSPETDAAFGRVDAEIARLLDCLRAEGVLEHSALLVVGDHGTLPVHTLASPNAALAAAGLLTHGPQGLVSWTAIARSNGGSAFVYARTDEDALLARRALLAEAERTRAFRIVSADEMLRLGADPEAWFGLEAEPGFVFSDSAQPPFLRPSPLRAVGGYLPGHEAMDVGFVAWGRGLRQRVNIPEMQQTDVAPTAARLLGLRLDTGAGGGRPLVGALNLPTKIAVPIAHEQNP